MEEAYGNARGLLGGVKVQHRVFWGLHPCTASRLPMAPACARARTNVCACLPVRRDLPACLPGCRAARSLQRLPVDVGLASAARHCTATDQACWACTWKRLPRHPAPTHPTPAPRASLPRHDVTPQVRNLKTQELTDLEVSGLFFAIGHEPATKFLGGQVRMATAMVVW